MWHHLRRPSRALRGPLLRPLRGPLQQPRRGPLQQPRRGALRGPLRGLLQRPLRGPLQRPLRCLAPTTSLGRRTPKSEMEFGVIDDSATAPSADRKKQCRVYHHVVSFASTSSATVEWLLSPLHLQYHNLCERGVYVVMTSLFSTSFATRGVHFVICAIITTTSITRGVHFVIFAIGMCDHIHHHRCCNL